MKKKILCLVMTLVMTAGAATTAFARDYQGADGWQVTFDGSKMSSNFQDNDVTDEMANIQPGDSIELKVNVMNSDSGSTDWYMTNEVIQTLEDAQQSAAGGGYSYRLTYVGSDKKETVLYDSTTVGGEGSSKAGEGLKQVDNSTQEYFYLGRLASQESGTVHLTVGVEGETQGNGYQLTLAKLRMNFATEKVAQDTVTTIEKTEKTEVRGEGGQSHHHYQTCKNRRYESDAQIQCDRTGQRRCMSDPGGSDYESQKERSGNGTEERREIIC